jgi:hypothetical protein
LLNPSLEQVLADSEVIVIGTPEVSAELLNSHLRPDHIVIDLVNLDKSRRPARSGGSYEGMCW